MKKNRNITNIFVMILRVIIEVFIIHIAFYAGYNIYMYGLNVNLYVVACPELNANLYYLPAFSNHYFTIAIGLSTTIFMTFAYLRLYRNDTSLLNIKEYRNVIIGYSFSVIIFLAFYYFFVSYTTEITRSKLFSRRILAYAIFISFSLVIFERAVINWIIKKRHSKGINVSKILIYGAGKIGKLTARRLFQFPAIGLWPVGFIDDDKSKSQQNIVYDPGLNKSLKVLGTRSDLERILKTTEITEIMIAMPSISGNEMLDIFNQCHKYKIPFRFVPNIYEFAVQKTQTDEIMGLPIIRLKKYQSKLRYCIIKRIFDIAISSILLLIGAPLFLIIAICIKKDSQGPVFFIQKRVGKDGKVFSMFKFRTMYQDKSADAMTPESSNDPRITVFGRLLRRSSLDELPQIINVLMGSMSLVGPRPEMLFIVEQYEEIHKERLKVKPGITGLWQISADRKLAIHENLDYDMYYIHEQSLLVDIIILVQTIFFAFKGI